MVQKYCTTLFFIRTFAAMNMIQQIVALIRMEILLEWRSKYAIGGIVLYVLSTVFVVYNASLRVEPRIWNTLFWIIVLFASVNAVTKSFTQENAKRQLYYYQLANPTAIIFAKIIYNSFLILVLNTMTYTVFSLVEGNPVQKLGLFYIAIGLGSIGLGVTLTFISAIANKAKNAATMMAVLSFPIIIPILVSLIQISSNAIGVFEDSNVNQDIMTLLAIDGILLGAAYLLFPFLWRD